MAQSPTGADGGKITKNRRFHTHCVSGYVESHGYLANPLNRAHTDGAVFSYLCIDKTRNLYYYIYVHCNTVIIARAVCEKTKNAADYERNPAHSVKKSASDSRNGTLSSGRVAVGIGAGKCAGAKKHRWHASLRKYASHETRFPRIRGIPVRRALPRFQKEWMYE